MLLEAQLNTRALAGAMAENIKSGFMGEGVAEDELEAAKTDVKHCKGLQPARMPAEPFLLSCLSTAKGKNRSGEVPVLQVKLITATKGQPSNSK